MILPYAKFEALYRKGILPPPGTRFAQPLAYQKAAADRAVRDAAFLREVQRLGDAGMLPPAGDEPDRICTVCGEALNRCSFWQCGAA